MAYPQLDRDKVRMRPVAARRSKKEVEADLILPDREPRPFSAAQLTIVEETAARLRESRRLDKPRMLVFGAHTIKNGLAPVIIRLLEKGWLTHLATNGAGIIHDWEFAFIGRTSEDVRANVARGEFGNWEETGFTINLALNVGAYEGKGYGESVGAMILRNGLEIPASEDLRQAVIRDLDKDPSKAAAAAELLRIVRRFKLAPGFRPIVHRWSQFSVQAQALRLGIPCTGHPMIGHDIIYNHPMNDGALLGLAALRDFLTFAEGVSRIEHGVYLSVGSAVMSPMIFEKSFSMAQNLALQKGAPIADHFMLVVDLAESRWDWSRGEPPEERPEFYLRHLKSFSRMGGAMRYLAADNRDFLLHLCRALMR